MQLLRLRPEVVDDLREAADWYDDQRIGLGGEFLIECKSKLDNIARRPAQGTLDKDKVRSVRLRRFPYVVYFRPEKGVVVIFAITYGGRRSNAWRQRLRE